MSSTNEHIVARGKIFELVQTTQPDGRIFEVARRAPGVRMIIADRAAKTVLLTREYRSELKAWDYRLPGGKVFDKLPEYEEYRASGKDLTAAAHAKALAESAEEAGIEVHDAKLVQISTLGATVEWDLYVFEATSWDKHKDGQQLEKGEQVEADAWVTFAAAESMILEGHMQEERIALVLLRWLRRNQL
jgi:hypothetical protein